MKKHEGKALCFLAAAAFQILLIGALVLIPGQKAEAAESTWAPVFNAAYYAAKYPDVAAAFGGNATAELNHFLTYGMKEGRQGSAEFNVLSYRALYPDLRAVYGNDLSGYFKHYILIGKKEGRIGTGHENDPVTDLPPLSRDQTKEVTDLTLVQKDGHNGIFSVRLMGVDPSKYTEVLFPTWTAEGGQDDIRWEHGVRNSDGTYSLHYNVLNNGKRFGTYVVNAYGRRKNGSLAGFGGLKFSFVADHYAPYGDEIIRRANGPASPTGYVVVVDKAKSVVGVFAGNQGARGNVSYMSCSAGAGNNTPSGTFTVKGRGYSFSGKNYTCYYFTAFIKRTYLFHSVLYKKGTFELLDGRLGKNYSHGCIRLALNDARWINEHIPDGTPVVIY